MRAAAALTLITAFLWSAADLGTPEAQVLHAAAGLTLLHTAWGGHLFFHLLRARSPLQLALDVLAWAGLLTATLIPGQSARWCFAFAFVFAAARLKYLLCLRDGPPSPRLTLYVREKLRLERWVAPAFAAAGLGFAMLPPAHGARLVLAGLLAAASAGFALWLFGIRRTYRELDDGLPPP
jgi:hypothetical protein